LTSDSRCRGVSPCHEYSRPALPNRRTSPISATITAEDRADAVQGLDDTIAAMAVTQSGPATLS